MKKRLTIILSAALLMVLINVHGQTPGAAATQTKPEPVKLYDPSLDGMKQIKEAVSKAKSQGKHVLVQYGGNWCGWCIKFDAFCKADTSITRIINAGYVPVKMNYDQQNRNDEANAYMGNPSRFGFPVFIIIDGNGKVLHIQDSALLEEGQGYSKQKVSLFFRNWTASAIVPRVQKPAQTK